MFSIKIGALDTYMVRLVCYLYYENIIDTRGNALTDYLS